MSEMLTGDYLGMPLAVDAGDHANQAFFRACSEGEFKVQKCRACALLWYPPSTGCPHCGAAVPEMGMANFSFNKPAGACPTCTGLGDSLIYELYTVHAQIPPVPGWEAL